MWSLNGSLAGACCIKIEELISAVISIKKCTWLNKQDWVGPQTLPTTYFASTPVILDKNSACHKTHSSICEVDNGMSVGVLAHFFRILEGSVILYTHKISSPIAQNTGFKTCIDLINGKLIQMDENLFVGDNKKLIIYYLTGWSGSSHDTQLWENRDSGFPMDSNLVIAFKKPPPESISWLRKKFD
ncbi:hypothetical protein VP01_4761g1 [Puccinia sorghi]|uniref:Uncharacterized protein n=1 Tax=Puccinia sorghi TaxID=27349 RepID=A0A0L6UNH1_9BASI|nr:hypothetical protein VP01_4761g1 [Puccinia sorghi]